MRALDDDPLVLGPRRLELEGSSLEELEDARPDPATCELRMDVPVADEPSTPPHVEVHDACEPSVDVDEPGVVLEVEIVPLLAQLVGRPVRIAPDSGVGRAEYGQRLVEPLGCAVA